ncbi:MAG: Ig-like domain-containing protein [Methanobrevibacter sp.]|nr:Ig-like domain-containing protein [Methanobrevibacter sp.]
MVFLMKKLKFNKISVLFLLCILFLSIGMASAIDDDAALDDSIAYETDISIDNAYEMDDVINIGETNFDNDNDASPDDDLTNIYPDSNDSIDENVEDANKIGPEKVSDDKLKGNSILKDDDDDDRKHTIMTLGIYPETYWYYSTAILAGESINASLYMEYSNGNGYTPIEGDVDVYLNGELNQTVHVYNRTNFILSDFPMGYNFIEAKFAGNEICQPQTANWTFYRYENVCNFTIDAPDIYNGTDAVINITLHDSQGNVLEDENFSVTIIWYKNRTSSWGSQVYQNDSFKSGILTIPASKLRGVGIYEMRIDYKGQNFTLSPYYEHNQYFIVGENKTSITFYINDGTDNENATGAVYLLNGFGYFMSGNVIITVDEKNYTVLTSDETMVDFTIDKLPVGSYEATATFEGDEDHPGCEATRSFTIKKFTEIRIDAPDVYPGDSITVNITVLADGAPIDGDEIYLLVYNESEKSGYSKYYDMENGVYSFVLENITEGVVIKATFYGNSSYADAYKVAMIRVIDDNYPIIPVVNDATIGLVFDGDNVIISLEDIEGNPISDADLSVLVNDVETSVDATDADGKTSVPISGNATVVVSYTDENQIAIFSSIVVINNTEVVTETVENKIAVPVNASISLQKLDSSILGFLTDLDGNAIADALVSIDENGLIYNETTSADGSFRITINGNMTVKATYTDKNNASVSSSFEYVNETKEIYINATPIIVYSEPNARISLTTEDGSSIIATLLDSDGNAIADADLICSLNGQNSTVKTDNDGKATIPISGNVTALVSYTDENNITSSSSMSLIVITNETVKEVNKTVVEYVNQTVEVPVEVEKIVEVVPNRTATKVIYSNMKTTAVAKVDGRVGKYFEVVLVDEKGNPLVDKFVQIGFNGAVYNRTTNATGGVRLQINLGYEGKYTFAIAFLGDDKYTGDFQVALIEVSPHIPKLTAPAKTYKASAKTKALTATFKSANGNAISGKKISFTVNGKTYTGTTNSKGVATVKISLNKKGTYQATAKYEGDGMYKATSTKFNVKIA